VDSVGWFCTGEHKRLAVSAKACADHQEQVGPHPALKDAGELDAPVPEEPTDSGSNPSSHQALVPHSCKDCNSILIFEDGTGWSCRERAENRCIQYLEGQKEGDCKEGDCKEGDCKEDASPDPDAFFDQEPAGPPPSELRSQINGLSTQCLQAKKSPQELVEIINGNSENNQVNGIPDDKLQTVVEELQTLLRSPK
jgi:hypothetical protein